MLRAAEEYSTEKWDVPNEVAMEKMRRYVREIAGLKHEILREDDRYRAQRAGSQIPQPRIGDARSL